MNLALLLLKFIYLFHAQKKAHQALHKSQQVVLVVSFKNLFKFGQKNVLLADGYWLVLNFYFKWVVYDDFLCLFSSLYWKKRNSLAKTCQTFNIITNETEQIFYETENEYKRS